jgi:hypothetical protein
MKHDWYHQAANPENLSYVIKLLVTLKTVCLEVCNTSTIRCGTKIHGSSKFLG